MNCRAAVRQLPFAGRCGGGVPKPGLLQDGDGTDGRTGWFRAAGLRRFQDLLHRLRHRRAVAGGAGDTGAGAKAKLTSADRVLVAALHLRKLATMDLLGQLFNTTAMTISRAAKDVRPLLESHSVQLPASTARLRTREHVARFLDADTTKIKPTC